MSKPKKDARGRLIPVLDESGHACLDRVLSHQADPSCCLSQEQIERDAEGAEKFLREISVKVGDHPASERKRLMFLELADVYEQAGSYRRAEDLRAEAREIAKDCPRTPLEDLVASILEVANVR